MLILLAVSIYGYMVAHRTITNIASEFSISDQLQKLFSAVVVIVIVALMLLTKRSPLTLWLFIGILLQTLKFFPDILRFLFIQRIRKVLIPYLDVVILSVQGGKSMRLSMSEATEVQDGWIRNQLREIHLFVFSDESMPPAKSALLKRFSKELHRIAHSQSKYLEQLKSLRRELKMKEDFRRRSGQVTQQLRAQAIIVTALYLGLLSFIILQFGFKDNQKMILLSSLIFGVGLVWMFLIGRKIEWKV